MIIFIHSQTSTVAPPILLIIHHVQQSVHAIHANNNKYKSSSLLILCERYPGPRLNIKTVSPRHGISLLKIRRSRDPLIFTMGTHILVRRHLYIETACRRSSDLTVDLCMDFTYKWTVIQRVFPYHDVIMGWPLFSVAVWYPRAERPKVFPWLCLTSCHLAVLYLL